jgi:branched-chain amino acid transport system ATP-binding protein
MTNDLGLSVRGLDVVYNNAVTALSGVSMKVDPGQFVAVLGANGAGKTTLVRAITGLLFIHGGAVREGAISFGETRIDPSGVGGTVQLGISQVPEGRMIFPRLSVEENLMCGASRRKRGPDVDADMSRMFEIFPQLASRRKDTAGLLSGGEQQMLAVGRALMGAPKLIICDELSLGLAPMIVKDLFELLTELNKESGLSVLVIEQNARIALENSDYGYVLETGKVVIQGPSAELRADQHVQEFYLGGAGDAKDAYEAVVARYRREPR